MTLESIRVYHQKIKVRIVDSDTMNPLEKAEMDASYLIVYVSIDKHRNNSLLKRVILIRTILSIEIHFKTDQLKVQVLLFNNKMNLLILELVFSEVVRLICPLQSCLIINKIMRSIILRLI